MNLLYLLCVLGAAQAVTQTPSDSAGIREAALDYIEGWYTGDGEQIPEARRMKKVTILDIYEDAASAKIVASDWIDYLHLARWNGTWKIVNVLWDLKPRDSE